MSENCIFCQIVSGQLESRPVYEDKFTLAFLDVNPLAPGHTVVIPKAHIERLEDLPAEQMGPLFEAVRQVTDKERLRARSNKQYGRSDLSLSAYRVYSGFRHRSDADLQEY